MKKLLIAMAAAGALVSACGTTTSTSTSSCCLGAKPNSKFYSCPTADAATMCFNNGSPGSCTADTSQDMSCNN